jgi:hypothetical protein
MDTHVIRSDNKYIIANPTNPLENFADKWEAHPERAEAFFQWAHKAKADFVQLAALVDRNTMTDLMEGVVGSALAKRAKERPAPGVLSRGLVRAAADQNRPAVQLRGGGRNA